MIIRPMCEDDIVPLAAIVARNYNHHCAESFLTEAACAFYSYPFRPRFIVAVDGLRVIGCVCWNSDWCSWGVYNLSWLQVKADLQRQGIGTALMNYALSELRPIAKLILLSTTKPEYHKKFGFKTIKHYQVATEYDSIGQESLMALEIVG